METSHITATAQEIKLPLRLYAKLAEESDMEPSKLEGPTGLKQDQFWVNTRELYRRIEELERALKVIWVWADFDQKGKSSRKALIPGDVSDLCKKVFPEEGKTR